jgi:hypothetical protein
MRIGTSLAFAALAALALAAGIAAALRLTRPKPGSAVVLQSPAIASIDSALAYSSQDAGHSSSLFRGKGAQSDILELPKASTDFVGYWGGYVHSSIQRLSPSLVGKSPDRVSVVFGRDGDTVFIASELYSSPTQKLVHHPNARMVTARIAIIEHESTDQDLDYICRDRFRLNDSATISYQGTIEVYDLTSHRLMGVVTQTARLKRLLTARDQRRFARPGQDQIPRAAISAKSSFVPP